MTALTKWNPFSEMETLHRKLNTLLDSTFGRSANGDETMPWSAWAPLVDIAEDDKEYVFRAELPGLKKQDVSVTIENGALKISGERKQEKEEKGRRYHRIECSYGKFSRSFTLPGGSNPDRIRAEFKDGVLSVHVAKSESAKPKQIEVESE
jgi:HSP20 family protein